MAKTLQPGGDRLETPRIYRHLNQRPDAIKDTDGGAAQDYLLAGTDPGYGEIASG